MSKGAVVAAIAIAIPTPVIRFVYPIEPQKSKSIILNVLRDKLNALPENPSSETIKFIENYHGGDHGVLWWRKPWEIKTSYTILVIGYCSSSNIHESIIRVAAETQERPDEKFSWQACSIDEKRVKNVLNIIDEALRVKR